MSVCLRRLHGTAVCDSVGSLTNSKAVRVLQLFLKLNISGLSDQVETVDSGRFCRRAADRPSKPTLETVLVFCVPVSVSVRGWS